MADLRTAPAARADLREIARYSKAAFGAAVAREYLDGLTTIFSLLSARPMIGAAERDLGASIRSFGYRSHRIYYTVEESGVLIVRVLHHARDVPQAFGPHE